MTNNLSPLSEPFADDVSAILLQYPKVEGQLLSLFRTFANSKRFLEKGVPNLLDKESPLTIREREIVILRTTHNNNCEYEWGVHVTVFGEMARFSKDQLRDVCRTEIDPALWSKSERVLLEVVDQLCTRGIIDESCLTDLQNKWSAEQQLEVLALCGTYHTISFVANVAKLDMEPFATHFPK